MYNVIYNAVLLWNATQKERKKGKTRRWMERKQAETSVNLSKSACEWHGWERRKRSQERDSMSRLRVDAKIWIVFWFYYEGLILFIYICSIYESEDMVWCLHIHRTSGNNETRKSKNCLMQESRLISMTCTMCNQSIKFPLAWRRGGWWAQRVKTTWCANQSRLMSWPAGRERGRQTGV